MKIPSPVSFAAPLFSQNAMSSILMQWLKVLLLFGRAPLSTVGLIQRNKLPVYLMYPSLRVGEGSCV
jgi:hypothetical protein